MPRSMTGFSRQEITLPWATLAWEIRSVNHRYLETHFRLPEITREIETPLREDLRKTLSRGKIEASLNFQLNTADSSAELGINLPLVKQLSSLLDAVAAKLTNPAAVNPLELLQWPGVMSSAEINRDELLNQAKALFQRALRSLVEHRQREGEELKTLIEQRLVAIETHVAEVRQRLPEILSQQRQRLLDKLAALKGELDTDRLEQELVYLAQKTDVDEELDRLSTHVAEVRRTLEQKGSVGRRLDFLMQELNREANTLSSKSIVTDTTQAAIELKVLIEQMREQIQNIE
ncbi:YicC family protein [Pseudomaricurvus alcaniphilus]|uniref:YicC/YloC family endoribonuclease n=1 Tax=Pseudomaricurvus alcaniphilus TaxID=1166482 RepID=UPI00140AB689|nr:YicC/YloC family endoribonuclease [Pseudomaricurvus alcaniphilus]NHN38627.1 YicC family protein [Pseudomaricurvus alcaniphilus]